MLVTEPGTGMFRGDVREGWAREVNLLEIYPYAALPPCPLRSQSQI